MKPLNDQVAILPGKEEDLVSSSSGIITKLKTSKNSLSKGVVKFVSSEVAGVVSVGETVVFPTGAGTPLEFDGVEYLLLNVGAIKAVV